MTGIDPQAALDSLRITNECLYNRIAASQRIISILRGDYRNNDALEREQNYMRQLLIEAGFAVFLDEDEDA